MLIMNNLFINHGYNEQHFIFGENLRDNSKIWINFANFQALISFN